VPVHPTTISAHLSGVDTVVNWDDPNQNEDGYKVYRIERIGNYYVFPWTQVGTVGPNVTTFTDSHPACEHTFLYRVTAYNISGESGSSPSITIGSQVCPPAAPSGLGYTSTQTSVTLTWQDNSNNEAGIEVLWRLMPNMAWLHLADVPPDTEQYIESGLVCSGAPLLYEVRAYNDGGQAYSGQISGVTQPCTPPAAPDGLAVDANSFNPNSLFLEWNDNSDNEDGFRIEKWNGSGWDAPFATTNPDVTDFQVTGLTCNTPYTFRVGAFNNYGEAYSAQASGTTAACSTDNMPKDLTATGISTSEIDLTWSQGGLATPTGYHVARYNPLMRNPWAVIATVSGTSYPDTGLSCGTTYYYKVNAYRDTPIVFTSDYTDVVSATTVECPPPAPHLLSVLPTSQSSLTVTWSVLRGSYDGFEVYRAPYPLPPIPLWIKIGTPDGAARSFVSDRLLCGTQYSYRVRAFNDGGYSAFSTSAMGQTLPCSPDAPDILAMASNTAASIDLTWHEASADVTGYHLERSPDGSSGWTEINVSTTNTPSYSDPGLTCGTPYFYRVYAYNTGGISTYSDVLAAATAACTPALVAQAGIQGLVTLSWSDSGHTATEYKLERSPNGTSGWTDLFPTTTITGSPQKDTNAPCGATLYYHIRALSADGNSPFSSPSQAVTVCKPTTSMNLSVARTSLTKAHLTWTATSGGQDHFRIERMIKGQYGWENLGTVSAATLQFMDTNIPDGVVYIYRIVAVNQGGETYSNMAQLNAQYHYRIPIIRK